MGEPREVVEAAARDLLAALSEVAGPVRVTDSSGEVACLILVWPASGVMPSTDRLKRDGGHRAECKQDILRAVRHAPRPLTRKQLVRLLREAGTGHGPGTIAKALADLTKSGELVNRMDKRGYRLPENHLAETTPSLFE
jgi:hypothetical protein